MPILKLAFAFWLNQPIKKKERKAHFVRFTAFKLFLPFVVCLPKKWDFCTWSGLYAPSRKHILLFGLENPALSVHPNEYHPFSWLKSVLQNVSWHWIWLPNLGWGLTDTNTWFLLLMFHRSKAWWKTLQANFLVRAVNWVQWLPLISAT